MKGFKAFLLRGNVVDLAVGVVIGAAFAGLVGAIVKDLLTPLISAIAKLPDFSGLFHDQWEQVSLRWFFQCVAGVRDRGNVCLLSRGAADESLDGEDEKDSRSDDAEVPGMFEWHSVAGEAMQVLYGGECLGRTHARVCGWGMDGAIRSRKTGTGCPSKRRLTRVAEAQHQARV
jgi:Large-conductance mechanosensitive channel, MscL